MGKALDLTGKKFGLLTALYPTTKREPSNKTIKCACQCDCGNYKIVNSNHLKYGKVKSCGCLKRRRKKNEKYRNQSIKS